MTTANANPALSRREFVLSATATAAVLGAGATGSERPILRIGAMTDNHLHAARPNTHKRTEACFDLFRRENVDIVVDTGDIADLSDFNELRYFRAYFDKTFAGTGCVPFFCIANHDYNYVPNTGHNDPKNIEQAWRALGMEGPNPTAVVKGYRFVNVFQNEPAPDALAKAVAKAVAETEDGKPVFVVNHVPPFDTTAGTIHWSSRQVRTVLNKYPQVVALTGHNHRSIAWAGNIWQGEFTNINLGAHAEYSNRIDGEAVVLDVFANRIDVRRYEAVSGKEIGADDRWSIPLPFAVKTAPYLPALRAKTCPVPTLPADAVVHYEQNASGTQGLFRFTTAVPRNTAMHYLLKMESQNGDGSWKFLTTVNWSTPQAFSEPDSWTTTAVLPGLLDSGRVHRVTITPVNSHAVKGPSRTFTFTAPINPMEELPAQLTRIVRYQHSQVAGRNVFSPDADGWFRNEHGLTIAALPKEFSMALVGKKTAMLVVDLAYDQPDAPNTITPCRFAAASGKLEFGLGERCYMLPGVARSHRFAWTFNAGKLAKTGDECCIFIREGGAHRFKVNDIRCYVV